MFKQHCDYCGQVVVQSLKLTWSGVTIAGTLRVQLYSGDWRTLDFCNVDCLKAWIDSGTKKQTPVA